MPSFEVAYKLNQEDEEFPTGGITMATIYSDNGDDGAFGFGLDEGFIDDEDYFDDFEEDFIDDEGLIDDEDYFDE